MKNVRLYNYLPGEPEFSIKYRESDGQDIIKFTLSYDSPYSTGIRQNDRVYARLFLKNRTAEARSQKTGRMKNLSLAASRKIRHLLKEPRKLLILVHGFSTRSKKLNNYYHFAEWMARHDVPCVFVDLPFHLDRAPEGEKSGARMIYYDDIQTLEFFHQAVVDIRRLLDIFLKLAAPSEIYICGISLGSMVSVVAMANEKRIDKGIFLIGGGNWEEVHWKGILRYILKGNCTKKTSTTWQDCHEIYRDFPHFLEILKELKDTTSLTPDLDEFPGLKKTATKSCFLCDPLAFAHNLDPEKVLMINSKIDFYFSKRSTYQLWEALGKPRIIWLNSLHTSKILTKNQVISQIYGFIENN